jgi:cell division protease FtsH
VAVNNFRNLALWIIIALLLVALFNLFQGPAQRQGRAPISFTDFNQQVVSDGIKQVTVSGNHIEGIFKNGAQFSTDVPNDPTLTQRLLEHNVDIKVRPEGDNITLLSVFINWFPMLLFVAVMIFLMRQMQAGGGKAMGFGKSRAKMLTERQGRVTFDDVAGVDEAKEDLVEIVDFLKDPQKFQKLGGRIPKGVLLVGPPGTGKTLLARAIAGEANVPFFTISGSDFVEMFVGVGASRVRDMFEQAKKNAPCIVFIDEIDAVGRHRGAGLGGGNDEREQTLNQLLVEMDGFEANEGVILIAATNRPDVLDPALLRPGRFDRQIVVPNPDLSGREKILKVHMRKVPLAPDVEARVIARGTPGFSGADLANLVNEAALLAARRGKRLVGRMEFEDAKDKVMMGAERRTLAMTDDEKKLTAYHEGGHALVALNVVGSDPIHKATIIPRGRALGMVMRLPERDALSLSRQKLYADLCVAFGGRLAEELIFGYDKVTTGAQSDIEMATRMARAMVTRFGMSDELGPIAYAENQEEVFLGHSVSRQQNVSEATAQKIDAEVRRIIEETYQRAKKILSDKIDDLHIVAKGLLEYETLTGDEIKALLRGEQPVRTPYEEPESTQPRPAATVPTAGRPRGGEGGGGGGILSPEPQPGT